MKVQLLATCLVDSLYPEVGVAAVELLTSSGVSVQFPPDQTCCGQPAMNAGHWSEATRMARHTIRVFEPHDDAVIIPSGSCAGMIRHGYQELFADQPQWLQRARRIGERAFELSEFLVDVLQMTEFPADDKVQLAYHPSCHQLRQLGIERPPLQLLQPFSATALSSECCGFGGLFALQHPEISAEMLERKIQEIERSGAEFVTGCDVSCLMHIEGGLRKRGSRVRCAHVAQVLNGSELALR